MKSIIFDQQDHCSLDKYLLKQFNSLKQIDIFKNIKNNIKVNNKKVKHNYLLNYGDEIQLYFDPNKTTNIPIVYEDENIIVVNKPTNLECINENNNNLISLLRKQTNNYDLKLVHRIDTNTSGIVIVTKNELSYNSLLELMKNNGIKKFYYALVYGHMDKKSETLKAYLYKDAKRNMVDISLNNNKNSKEIITKYLVVNEYKKYTLLEIELLTGRTHQIRAHMNFINHPIVGEKKYIKKSFDKDTRFKYQALTAYKIKFNINNEQDFLFYLNNKEIKLNKIYFLDKLK